MNTIPKTKNADKTAAYEFSNRYINQSKGGMKMSENFNKNVSAFLIACRESALKELAQNNEQYKKLIMNTAEISKKVKNEIPAEYETLIENLTDSIYALARMEMNYLYFRGYKDCVSLSKIFDSSFTESEQFEALFI